MSRRKHFINMKAGESMEVAGALITLEKKAGSVARLVVLADDSVNVKNPKEVREQRTAEASSLRFTSGTQECAPLEMERQDGEHPLRLST